MGTSPSVLFNADRAHTDEAKISRAHTGIAETGLVRISKVKTGQASNRYAHTVRASPHLKRGNNP